MTDAQRTHLRALAQRVRTEEPSEALRDAVLIALGWRKPSLRLDGLVSPGGGYWTCPPNPLTSLDAAAGAMPEGWTVLIDQNPGSWGVSAIPRAGRVIFLDAPTEPRARTSAALEAMAGEGE